MKILFIGYEVRYVYLINEIKSKYDVYTVGYNGKYETILNNINDYDIVVLPMGGIKNGYAGNVKIDDCIFDNYKGVIYTGRKAGINGNVQSFLDDEEIKKANDRITVDGIMARIKDVDKHIICILGFGNIGSMVYNRLKDNYKVIVGVKDNSERTIPNSFVTSNEYILKYILEASDLIINTVPNNIISEDILKSIQGYFLDIASYPYAIDQSKINEYNFKYDLYSSIPSKYAPEKAGKILLKKF